MVVTVVVTGVPQRMSLENLTMEFNDVLEEEDLGSFSVRDIAMSNNKMFKRQVALDFESGFDAMTVQEKLDGFELVTSGGSCNIIKAKITTVPKEPEPCTKVVISTTSRSDYYEPYVEDFNESLDMQIDLLKKKTLALKAHRKFIQEQKKLKKEFTKLDVDSDNEIPKTRKIRKRKRSSSTTSGSSDSVDRSKSRDNYNSPKSPERNKSSKSQTCEDYLAIKYKRIPNKRRSESRKISESYKKRSRSRSCEKRNAAYCATEYKKSTQIRESNSPEPRNSSHRIVRSKSRRNHRSPTRTSGTRERRSRSRNRKKYYSLETIEYKKALVTETKPMKFRSKYESREQCVFRSASSKQRRSPSPHKGDLRSKIVSRKRKTLRSRSRSNSQFQLKWMKTSDFGSGSKSYKNRYPSTENRSTISYEKSRPKYYNDSCPKTENNSSEALGSQWKPTKATENRKSDHEDLIKLNAEIQSKKMQAMEDVLFEMELLLRQERNTISNADTMLLTALVKGIVKNRFQKLHINGNMVVRDVVTRYRSQYSKDDDMNLLQNLANECKSLDGVTSEVVAESTAKLLDLQSKNDEIWTAVDEVLDGVDIDMLQAEPETNEVEANENYKRESHSGAVETVMVNVTNDNMPDYIETKQIDSTSETDVNEINTKCVSGAPKHPKIRINKAINSQVNLVDLTCDMIDKNENITSSEKALMNPKDSIRNLAIVKAHVNDTHIQNSDKIQSIELSDDSDSDMENVTQINVTRTINQEHIAMVNSVLTSHITDVVTLANIEKRKKINSSYITKQNLPTVDLTDDTDEIEINDDQNIASSETHLKSIKKEIVTDMTNNQSNVALSPTNLLSYIKQEKIKYDFDKDERGTHDESNISIFDPHITKSIKKEKVATDKNINHDKCGILSETYLLSTIKQEPGTTVKIPTDHPDKPEINNEQHQYTVLDINILKSIKIEKEITVANKLTNNAFDTQIKKDTVETTIPVIISNCIKQENVTTVNDSISQNETSDINNDQIIMPVPIILSCIKHEDVATVKSVSLRQSYVTNINNDHIRMPGPIKLSCVNQEQEASNNGSTSQSEITGINNSQITMPVPIVVRSVKSEDNAMINSDSSSHTILTDINSVGQIKKSGPIKSNCTMQQLVAKNNDTNNQIELTDIDNDQISKLLPTVSSGKIEDMATVNSDTSRTRKNKTNSEQFNNKSETKNKLKHEMKRDSYTKYREQKYDSIKHKKERHSSIELNVNKINHSKEKNSKHEEVIDGSIKSKEKRDSVIKQKYIEPLRGSTNHEQNKSSGDVLNTSAPDISESSNINEQEKNLRKDKVPPPNPQFILPTHVVMRSLNSLIKNKFNEYEYMFNITRKVLQDRFKDLVKDKGYIKAKNIIKMYKDFYAEENYTDFLSGIVAGIKAGKYDEEIKKYALRQDKLEKKKQSTLEESQKIT